MSATVYFGDSFERVQVTSVTGATFEDIVPVNGGYKHFSHSSIKEMKEYARTLGIAPDEWPDYSGLEMPARVPLENVLEQTQRIRHSLAKVTMEDVKKSIYLTAIQKIVADGKQFFII